ncbi:MAG: glycosyltransferase family 2 protein [Pseudomonadota bacterium]
MTVFHYEKNRASVLIPVYNRGSLLGECIESAISQTYKDFEVVIVDNASTDDTWNVCQAWAKRDSRIRIFRNKENLGPVRNWQRCLDEATGEFCKFLFSDDKLMPDCLSKMVEAIQTHRCEVVVCSALIGESELSGKVFYTQTHLSTLNQLQYLGGLIKGTLPVSPGAIFAKTSITKKNLQLNFPTTKTQRYSEHGAGPDVMIILGALRQGQALTLAEPLCFFRAHLGSFSIGNMRSEVVDSYRSVIAWTLTTQHSKKHRDIYIALEWIRQIKKYKKWVSIKKFSIDYEGNGTIKEAIEILGYALGHLIVKSLRKKYKNPLDIFSI